MQSFKSVLVFAVLAVVVASVAVDALVCTKNFCDNAECEDMTECRKTNGFKVKEKGGFCSCCDICITQLEVGDPCIPDGELLGVVRYAECREGIFCSPRTRKCMDWV